MGLAIAGQKHRWPKGTIPYVLDAKLVCKDEAEAAVAHWNKKSCIRFVPHAGEADHVRLERLPGKALSDVGRRGGKQRVALGDKCSVGTVIHELGHAVGLWHEHCRGDRDKWVAIDWSNVEFGHEDNFSQDKIGGEAIKTVDLGAYDYGSIMHYGVRTFAVDPRDPVLKLIQPVPPGIVVGQRAGLSEGDIAAVAKMYA